MHYAVLKIFTNAFNWLTYLKRETYLFQISIVFDDLQSLGYQIIMRNETRDKDKQRWKMV